MRRLTVNAQVTAALTLLESCGNILCVITWLFIKKLLGYSRGKSFFGLPDYGPLPQGMTLYFVILPYCFLMNTHHNRNRIIDNGWFNVLRNVLPCRRNISQSDRSARDEETSRTNIQSKISDKQNTDRRSVSSTELSPFNNQNSSRDRRNISIHTISRKLSYSQPTKPRLSTSSKDDYMPEPILRPTKYPSAKFKSKCTKNTSLDRISEEKEFSSFTLDHSIPCLIKSLGGEASLGKSINVFQDQDGKGKFGRKKCNQIIHSRLKIVSNLLFNVQNDALYTKYFKELLLFENGISSGNYYSLKTDDKLIIEEIDEMKSSIISKETLNKEPIIVLSNILNENNCKCTKMEMARESNENVNVHFDEGKQKIKIRTIFLRGKIDMINSMQANEYDEKMYNQFMENLMKMEIDFTSKISTSV